VGGDAHGERLARGNAAQKAAREVREEARPTVVADTDLVGVVFAGELGRRHAGADFYALDGINAHHGTGEVLVELAVDGCTPSGRRALGHHLDHGAHRGPGLAHLVEVVCPGFDDAGIGRKEGVVVDLGPVPARTIYSVATDLDKRATHGDAGHDLAGARPGSHAHGRLARAGAPTAPVIADAVLLPVCEIRVPGSELVLDVGIVARPLIEVVDEQ